MRKIRANNLRPSPRRAPQRKRQIPRAAAQIEHARIAPLQNRPHAPRDAPPPQAIQLHRQQMIQQVVPRRDLRKHIAHREPRIGLGSSAFKARAFRWNGRRVRRRNFRRSHRLRHFRAAASSTFVFATNCGANRNTLRTASSEISSYDPALPSRGDNTNRNLP